MLARLLRIRLSLYCTVISDCAAASDYLYYGFASLPIFYHDPTVLSTFFKIPVQYFIFG